MPEKVKCMLFDSTDIAGQRIGGGETLLKGFIKYAPAHFAIQVVGVTADLSQRPLRQWTSLTIGQKKVLFFPVLYQADENKKKKIPLSLQYVFQMLVTKWDVKETVLFFNRIEPTIVFQNRDRAKIVVIHNDLESQLFSRKKGEAYWNKIPFLYKLFEKHVFKNISHVYTVSEKTTAYYNRTYPSLTNHVSFLPTWVDTQIFSPSKISKRNLRKKIRNTIRDIPYSMSWILFVGRLQKQKDPLTLLHTFARYLKSHPDIVLIMVGAGNLEKEVDREIICLGIQKNVYRLSYMDQYQLAWFYQAADALIVTSLYEGMPVSVLEALGCGLPVISTRVGEVPRVVLNGRSGEIVDNTSGCHILEALRKVLTSSEQYSVSNCISAIQDYTPQKVLSSVYHKIETMAQGKLTR